MKKNNSSSENKNRENNALVVSSAVTSVVLALSLLTGIVAILVAKIRSDKKYKEKWKDYDECGLS